MFPSAKRWATGLPGCWLVLLLLQPTSAAPAARPAGRAFAGCWLYDGNAVVEITQSAPNDTYVGHYVAFRARPAAPGCQQLLRTVALANLHPLPTSRSRRCLGGTLRQVGTSQEYPVEVELADARTLRVHVKIMGLTAYTLIWTRQRSAAG